MVKCLSNMQTMSKSPVVPLFYSKFSRLPRIAVSKLLHLSSRPQHFCFSHRSFASFAPPAYAGVPFHHISNTAYFCRRQQSKCRYHHYVGSPPSFCRRNRFRCCVHNRAAKRFNGRRERIFPFIILSFV